MSFGFMSSQCVGSWKKMCLPLLKNSARVACSPSWRSQIHASCNVCYEYMSRKCHIVTSCQRQAACHALVVVRFDHHHSDRGRGGNALHPRFSSNP